MSANTTIFPPFLTFGIVFSIHLITSKSLPQSPKSIHARPTVVQLFSFAILCGGSVITASIHSVSKFSTSFIQSPFNKFIIFNNLSFYLLCSKYNTLIKGCQYFSYVLLFFLKIYCNILHLTQNLYSFYLYLNKQLQSCHSPCSCQEPFHFHWCKF